ncbi:MULTISPECIES: hypothetical protein [unclassified Frankia]
MATLPGDTFSTFNPRDRSLVTVDGRGARLWETRGDEITHALCGSVTTTITEDQWRRYAPDLAYRPLCR